MVSALVGALALLHAGWIRWRRPGEGRGPLAGGEIAVLVGLVGVSFATSAGFMTDRPRPDHLVYGRYNDMFVALLVVLGLGAMVTAWTWRRACREHRPRRGRVDRRRPGAPQPPLRCAHRVVHAWNDHGGSSPWTLWRPSASGPSPWWGSSRSAVVALCGWLADAARRPWIVYAGCTALLAVGLVRAHSTYEERYVQPDPSSVEQVDGLLADDPAQDDDQIVCAMTADARS